MRFEGALTEWDAQRASGYITPAQGGEPVFVHIKAFGPNAPQPHLGQRLSFEARRTWEGRARARHVRVLGGTGGGGPARRLRWGTGAWVALLVLGLGMGLVAAWAWSIQQP